MELLSDEARIAMFCSGAADIDALRRPGVLVKEERD
jgi:isopentenyl diphosphate isomerase/L-lactate dehydrogenase-like FMN-dependent dehydrogenase